MLKRLFGRVISFAILQAVQPIPPGLVADKSALFGLFGLWSNLNNFSGDGAIPLITTAGTNTNLTAGQATGRILQLNSGASGGFTITLPSTAALIAAMGPTIPLDGSFGMPFVIINNNVGQIGTLTAGDAGTTLTGTMTIATNTVREFWIQITGAGTVTITNCGSKGL